MEFAGLGNIEGVQQVTFKASASEIESARMGFVVMGGEVSRDSGWESHVESSADGNKKFGAITARQIVRGNIQLLHQLSFGGIQSGEQYKTVQEYVTTGLGELRKAADELGGDPAI